MEIRELNNETPLTMEEGYELTKFYVHYFWVTNKFYSLKNEYEEEDVVQILMIKFIQHNHFNKYNSKITSKKYHVMRAVSTSMIDLLRKHKEVFYLDEDKNEDGLTWAETIESDENLEEYAFGKLKRDSIINQLPNTSKSSVTGYSPLLEEVVNLSYRNLALHLEAGYRIKDLIGIYKNPETGDSVSSATISKYIKDMREYILDNIVIA